MAATPEKLAELRALFNDKYSGSILDDTYHRKDVKLVKKNDQFLTNLLNMHAVQGNVKKATDTLNTILLFRAKYALNEMTEDDLNAELKSLNGVFYHGVDNKGQDILQFRVSKQKKGNLVEEAKKYIAFNLNKHYMENMTSKIVMLFDFTDAGIGNMDLDISKFIVVCLNTNFPGLGDYSLNFKMPLVLEAVWKIIKGWLDAEQAKTTFMVTRSNIQNYINQDQLLPHQIKEDKKK